MKLIVMFIGSSPKAFIDCCVVCPLVIFAVVAVTLGIIFSMFITLEVANFCVDCSSFSVSKLFADPFIFPNDFSKVSSVPKPERESSKKGQSLRRI